MSKKYDEVMEHVKLSDAARARILDKIDQQKRKSHGFQWKQWAALAACLVVVIAGVLVWNNQNKPTPGQDPIVMVPTAPVECADLAELEKGVGFPVEDIAKAVPEAEQITYINYANELAEINLTHGEQAICFRKSKGDEDNTGDYNIYDTTKEVELNGIACTMKGNGDTITLVIWQKDGYTYSLSFEPATSTNEASALCEQVLALQ